VEGGVTRSYYWLGGQRIAMRVDHGETSEVTWFPAGCGMLRSHTDHPSAALRTGLGSTSLLSTISGTLVMSSTTRFLPFVEYRVEPEAGLTDKGFTGHAHNDTIKLIDMKARWYSGQIGRFIQPDTIVPDSTNPQSLNRYAYVQNNPVVCSDPSGHCAWCRNVVRTVLVTGIVLFGNPYGEYRVDNFPQGPELTDFLLGQMNANATSEIAQTLKDANSGNAADKYAAYLGWAALVQGGGPWDYKVELDERELERIELGGTEYRSDVLANVHFGYVGRASGFSSEELLMGAGVAQVLSGTSDWSYFWSCFDDPADQAAISVGIYLYDQYGRFGLELTEDMLQEALVLYSVRIGEPD